MKCVIPSTNAKVFSKAIQSLAKIGTELFIQANVNYLSIRTLNSTKSAFTIFKFFPNFFTDYTLDDSSDLNKCKVSLKACIGVFKNMKYVEHCKISVNSNESKLVVQLKCRLDTVKTHLISIIDIETLQAAYIKDNIPNKIIGTHKLFSEISNNFQMNEEEITIEANLDKLVVKNYVEGTRIDRRFMRSKLTLKTEEFEQYSIEKETSVTFCLREFRALLNFAESINLPLTVLFETAGRPIIFIVENLQTFEANLVMSTLSPDDISTYENSNTLQSTITNLDDSLRNSSARRRDEEEKNEIEPKKARLENNSILSTENELFNFKNKKTISNTKSVEEVRDSSDVQMQIPSVHISPIIHEEQTNSNENVRFDEENKDSDGICVTFKDTEDVCDNSVPASPPKIDKKKTRTIFRRCFEATFNPKELSSYKRILAKNSDSED